MRRVGRARGEGFGLEREQALAAHGRAQALATDAVAFSAQGDRQAAGPMAAFMPAKLSTKPDLFSSCHVLNWMVYCCPTRSRMGQTVVLSVLNVA